MTPPEDSDDATLARLARDGSSSAFGILVQRHHRRVFGFLIALTHHRQDAEDLTQETFLRAWRKFHRFDPSKPLLPWLLTLARRQGATALRRKRPPAAEVTPAAQAEPTSRALWLWQLAEAKLSTVAYSTLWLHYREELPLKQVAAILGKREGAVKVILHRARKSLAASAQAATSASLPACLPEPQRANT